MKKKRYLVGKVGCRKVWAHRGPRSQSWTILTNTGQCDDRVNLLFPPHNDVHVSSRTSPSKRIIRDLRDFFTLLLKNTPQ